MANKTGVEDLYILKNNKRLRFGYTTGSCAAAAAKAATIMLLSGSRVDTVELMTPKGIKLNLELKDITIDKDYVSCAVQKDGGDDPDATHGILIYAKVCKIETPEIQLDGGLGVGRVTKKGLEQSVGSAAINRVPRQMLREAVKEICEVYDYPQGIKVEIFIPEGVEIAKKTFNSRLGIEGGLSVLGTSGIVEPMSEASLIASIQIEMNMQAVNGTKYLLICPGNYGVQFIKDEVAVSADRAIKCSNYIGQTLDYGLQLGIKGILFISHIGKFVKVAAGIMNTHSREADARMEILAANAIKAGATTELAKDILHCITTDEALDVLKHAGILEETMNQLIERIQYYLNLRTYNEMEIGVIIFSNQHGLLGKTKNTEELLKCLENYTE